MTRSGGNFELEKIGCAGTVVFVQVAIPQVKARSEYLVCILVVALVYFSPPPRPAQQGRMAESVDAVGHRGTTTKTNCYSGPSLGPGRAETMSVQ